MSLPGKPMSPGDSGTDKGQNCDRQVPQPVIPRTKLVRNSKITSLGWKMEKGWDLFG